MAVTGVIELIDCKGIDCSYSVKPLITNWNRKKKLNGEKHFWNIDVEKGEESFMERQVDD